MFNLLAQILTGIGMHEIKKGPFYKQSLEAAEKIKQINKRAQKFAHKFKRFKII